MYKYKQTTDVGDLVIWTNPSIHIIANKPYRVISTGTTLVEIKDESTTTSQYGSVSRKTLFTKPADQAVVGDYMYRVSSGNIRFPQYSIIKITKIDNKSNISNLYYASASSVSFNEVIVIAQAEPEITYPLFKEDIQLGFIFKYTGPNEGIYLTNKGVPNRKPGEYLSTMSSEDNAGWKPCDFTIKPDIDDIDWWQARFEAGLPVYIKDGSGDVYKCNLTTPKSWGKDCTFSMTDLSLAQQAPTIPESAISFALYPSGAPSKPTQTTIKEQPMKLQQLLDTIFGVSDYEAKPKFIVTVFNNDKEVATTTAESVEEIQQTIQSDTRLWGCKLVAYKIHSELQTQVPVAITKFKKESNA